MLSTLIKKTVSVKKTQNSEKVPVKEAFVDSKNFCKFTPVKLKSSTCKEKVILSEKSHKFLRKISLN